MQKYHQVMRTWIIAKLASLKLDITQTIKLRIYRDMTKHWDDALPKQRNILKHQIICNNTSNSYHQVLQLLLFFHHDQQLHGRNHKGRQRIELHQCQSRPAVIIYQV